MISRLALFGSAGDLAGRFLLPALATLHAEGRLPAAFTVVGADTADHDDEAFRRHVAERLERHAKHVPASSRDALVRSLRYRPADVADADAVARVVGTAGDDPLVAYLALPPRAFPAAVTSLARAGLPAGSRVAVEKPFGENLRGARELNALLARVPGAYRVDHVLGMPALEGFAACRDEEADEVEILWEETLALEGRAGFYDAAGALKDVLQNHMMQLLAIVAMEPAASVDELHDRKVEVLRAVRPPADEAMGLRTRRARYAAGATVPAYVDEDGVDPGRGTETFAEVLLEVGTPRWAGTRFRMRAGKALAHDFKGVVLRRRDSPDLRLEVDRLGEGELPAYCHVLLDVLGGGSTLSVRGDEAEEAWRIVTPVLQAWADGRVPLEEYPAGSDGPARRRQ